MGVRPDGTDTPPQMDFVTAGSAGGTLNNPAQTKPTDSDETAVSIPFALLNRKHAEYDADYWRVCRGLYSGGRKLFRDIKLLKHLFPPHRNEPDFVYDERLKRAFYIPYSGEIIDFIVAGLMGHPIELMDEGSANEEPYYAGFFEDVSAPGGKRQKLNQLLRKQILTALICKQSWTQIDFPDVAAGVETEAEQEQVGALDAYAFALEPEQVYDWEEDGTGALRWAKVCVETNERPMATSSGDWITRVYTIYTHDSWARYKVSYHRDKPPKPKDMIPLEAAGDHSFPKVPLIRLTLPDGLWAMSKLEGIATEHFNKRCALAWAEYKSLYQERHEFQGEPDPLAGGPSISEDEGRSTNQVHGTGWTQVRYAGDRVEFIGPDSAPFEHAQKSCDGLRDEMHRVTYQMALAVDVGSAALRQSGDSKKENRAAHSVVLSSLGEHIREHAEDITQCISAGRKDPYEWTASGGSNFTNLDLSQEIVDAELLQNIDIPSPTFQRRHKYALAKAKLGDEASEEDLAAIEKELEDAYTPEQMGTAGSMMELGEMDEMDGLDAGEEYMAPPPGVTGFSSRPKRNGA